MNAAADKEKRGTKKIKKSSQNFWKLKKASYICTPLRQHTERVSGGQEKRKDEKKISSDYKD